MANMEQDSLLIQYFDGKFKTIEVRLDNIDSIASNNSVTLNKQALEIKHHISRTDVLETYVRSNDSLANASTTQTIMWSFGIVSSIFLTFVGFTISKNFDMFRDVWKKLN